MINRLRYWTRAFFGISTREANGLLVLLPLLLLSVLVVPAYRHWRRQQPVDFTHHQRKLDSLLAHWPAQDDVPAQKQPVYFRFDPNTASREDFDSLGFPGFLAQRIENYRAKNGKFKIKTDLLRIYGLDTTFYRALEPYIQLPARVDPIAQATETRPPVVASQSNRKRMDLNTADSTQLKKIYGIGTRLSARIINYRNKLGGFVSLDQLYEVYGLDTAVITRVHKQYFIDTAYEPRKIVLNQATERDLSNHPYINYALANAIATYRFQHGNFSTLEEVKKIALVDEAFYNKILPYLSLNP